MQAVHPGFIIVAGSIGGLLLGLVVLTLLLSFFRQRRARKKQQMTDDTNPYKPGSIKLPAAYVPKEPLLPPTVKRVVRTANDKTEPIPEHLRLKPQAGTPDQVVIQIEPLEGPTRDESNVKKLIAYLKEEASRSNASKSTATSVTPNP